MKITIAGAGAFGTALAIALSHKGPVTLWARDEQAGAAMLVTRLNARLPDARLPVNITISAKLGTILGNDIVLLALPAQALGEFLADNVTALAGKILVACSKGIDLTTLTGPTGTIRQHIPSAIPAILTGPSFAADIAKGLPTALTLACKDDAVGTLLQTSLSTNTLRLYRTTDTTGAELGGALKNVIAIACGATIGAGLGDSAHASLLTRGFAEMQRLALLLGAEPDTLAGLSGLGDLVLTCASDQSRNFRFGHALGRGASFDACVTVEGVATAKAVTALARTLDIEMPISAIVAALVTGQMTVQDAMKQLLTRPLKEE
jgi:glycerol-3-phosphate dehydrogenase (NAD(P)+)